MNKPKTVGNYIGSFPPEVQKILQQIRATIQKAAPKAEDAMGYGVASFRLNGKPLVYYAAFKNHIGFYPTAEGIHVFKDDLKDYEQSKGTVRFPIDKPMPLDLITKIVKFLASANIDRLENKV
jgi:uncharacterized protein YdhG (YjbR/CyaY superfamily)